MQVDLSAVPRAPLRLWMAVVIAVAAGPIMDAGFPDRDLWPLTLVGVALYLIAFRGRNFWGAFATGFVGGLSFYLVHIEWASLFLGPVPMLSLATLESLFFALGASLIALAYRVVPAVWPSTVATLSLLPIVIAGLWTAREALASVWPYGGFAWGRVALSQSESSFSELFGWLGISGVSFVLVALVALTYEAIRLPAAGALARATVVVTTASVLLVVPLWPVSHAGTITVAAVQGAGKAGYFDSREVGDLLTAQVDATRPLFGKDVDVVVWPESGTDISPLNSEYAARVFDFVTENMDAPLISGAITERDGNLYNSSLLWKAGVGATDLYDKKHPVPFGEYVPDRAFWRQFAPDLIDLIGREYTPGTTDTVFDVDGVIVGVNICFDITDDQILTESVEEGAQIIFGQSNNADFGRTDESVQQLAIARIRAIELGRTVVNISTVGTSAIIGPNGETINELEWFTPGAMVEEVPLANHQTLAVTAGRQFEWLVSGLGLGALLVALVAVRRPLRARRG
ncbi:MAG: apolipoprotein N-acyltransferase [Microbacteriaceae bacterium]